jgi:hypothetical protein
VGSTAIWSSLHIFVVVVWIAGGVAGIAVTRAIKNAELPFVERSRRAALSRKLQFLPRACFALTLPVGLELTGAGNIYPLNPGLRVAFWAIALVWLVVIAVSMRTRAKGLGKALGYLEIVFAALAGMGFVVYGLNSLATGAPIDDPWFAGKLFLFGVALWTLIAVDLNFRSLNAPFEDIGVDGSTPEAEEEVARAINFTVGSMAALYVLLIVIALLGTARPF